MNQTLFSGSAFCSEWAISRPEKAVWRSNLRAQGLEHTELDSNKPLQRLRVLLKFIESVLPHHCLGSPWWFRLPMVSLYTLWLTTQIELWGRRASFQPNNSLELENLCLMKIKSCIHTHVCGYALPLNVEKRTCQLRRIAPFRHMIEGSLHYREVRLIGLSIF